MNRRRLICPIFLLLCGAVSVSAQVLQPQTIWYKIIRDTAHYNAMLLQKGFKLKYSGPRKEGGWISCYRQLDKNEWLFLYGEQSGSIRSLVYCVPTTIKINKFLIDKKQLLPGEENELLGKAWEQGQVYYQVKYTYALPEIPEKAK